MPARRYEIAEWKHARVNIDYCVTFDHRHYSVPYALVGEAVEIRATGSVVEILHKGVRVASHPRHYGPKGAATIADEHRPRAHREYGKWPPERVVAWAESVGGHVGELASAIMGRRTHPETGYRACLGVIRLADRYGRERVDAACARAISDQQPELQNGAVDLEERARSRAALRAAASRCDRTRQHPRCFVFRQGGRECSTKKRSRSSST